jgi:hypothetical protein
MGPTLNVYIPHLEGHILESNMVLFFFLGTLGVLWVGPY